MSEKMYALLLQLYPLQFREAYGDEALQLVRDRVRDERGFMAQVRLWLNLLGDLAVSIPREYWREEGLIGAAARPNLCGAPGFQVLESDGPRLGAQFCAGVLSLAGFVLLLIVIGNSWNYLLPGAWFEQLQVRGEARTAGSEAHLLPASFGLAQTQSAQPNPQDATSAIVQAFGTHNVVMFGEAHGNRQEYEWLCKLVGTTGFADRVDDIVVEFGNSLYQNSVDRYIAGEDVPLEQVRKAWRNVIGSVGPPSPVYEQFYRAVREANMKRRGKHRMRVLLGDPHRDEWYAQVVKDEVLAKNHRALLIMGAGHFLRRNGPGLVEGQIRAAGANPYLVVFGTNAVGGYDDLDKRFDSWRLPAIVALSGNWVGDLPAMPVVSGGTGPATQLKLGDAADALLYVGPRDALTQLRMPRQELDGTPYGIEMARRLTILMGRPGNFLYDQPEAPQFERPQPHPSTGGGPPMGAPPKSIHDPLPPRPPSQ